MVALCIHLANVFYLASFLVRDMLWLRALTCVGLMLGVVFFSCQKTPMYGPTAWHLVFLAINGVQILRLVTDRRRMTLSEEQARFAEAAFRDLSREELLTLLTRVTSARDRRCTTSGSPAGCSSTPTSRSSGTSPSATSPARSF